MIDFSAWTDKPYRILSLSLDPKNPRLPEFGHNPSERELVAALVEHEDVYELAKSITDRGGLYPSERLVAVKEGEDTVIVEGNRRLAALKLLESPDLAPDAKIKAFSVLKAQIPPQNVEKVDVVLAPSREAAAPLISDRHTGTAQRKWLRVQQAKFIRTQVGPGHTIDDVAKLLGMTRGEILESLRVDTMLQVASVMPLPADVREVVQDPRKFNFSVLERLIETPATPKFLGFAFAADGSLSGQVHEDEFKRGYTRLVSDVARGKVDTRKLNSAKEIHAYLGGFGKDTPNKQKKGAFTSESLLSGKTAESDSAKKVATPKVAVGPAVPRDSKYLFPRNFKCSLAQPRIKEVFTEMR